jgi:hypothetical protein
MGSYYCVHCGRALQPMLLWSCPDDTAAAQRVGGVVIDHTHEPDHPYVPDDDKASVDWSAWKLHPDKHTQ